MGIRNVDYPASFTCEAGLRAPPGQKVTLYKCYADRKDKNLVWLVGDNCINPADHIYVGYTYDTGSRGYGGRIMVFNLVDHNRAISLYGPWHSNTDALYENTGVDVRDKHYVQFVAGLGRLRDGGRDVITDIVHYEEPGVRGYYDYKALLPRLYERYKASITYWHGGSGGSTFATYIDRDYAKDPLGKATPNVDNTSVL